MRNRCPVHDHVMPFDADYIRDPYPVYEQLRESAPIHRICLPEGTPAWLVTRYEDVSELLKDKRLARNRRHANDDYTNELLPEFVRTGNLHMEDGDVHTRLRRFMNFAFTPKRVDALVPSIRTETELLLDRLAAAGGGDFMDMVAAPLPIKITVEMLGIPDDMGGEFRNWADAILGGDIAVARAAGKDLLEFIYKLIARKQEEPGDDLMSHWVHHVDEDGYKLTEQEMVGMTFFLSLGGYDTTVGSAGSALLALLTQREKADRLRKDPGLIPNAVEELLRWDGSAHNGLRRFATEDLVIGDVKVAQGDTVILSIASANHDPRHFPDPQVLDFDRDDLAHWAFGRGPHHCPGKELARIELRILLERVLERFPDMTLAMAPEDVQWRPSYIVRSPRKILVNTGTSH